MKSVQEINISPVKSFGLSSVGIVHVRMRGIVEDRRLFLIDNHDRLVTQREVGRLTQVKADYRSDSDRLCLDIPGSDSMEGSLETGEPVATKLWGRDVTEKVVTGDWGMLSRIFADRPFDWSSPALPGNVTMNIQSPCCPKPRWML